MKYFFNRGHNPAVVMIKVIVVAFFLLLGWSVLNKNLVLSAHVGYQYRPGQKADGIIRPDGASLTRTASGPFHWRISTNSFSIRLHIPRLIDSIRLNLTLPDSNAPAVYVSSHGKTAALSSRKLIDAKVLNDVHWPTTTVDGLTLWQRPTSAKHAVAHFDSIDAFTTAPPNNLSKVGLVEVNPWVLTKVTNYHPANDPLVINHTLRGSHDFYLYAANETINFSFDKVDLNRVKTKSKLTASIEHLDHLRQNDDEILTSITIGDDGNASGNGLRGGAQRVSLTVPNATPGLYLIHIATSEDVLLQQFSSAQHLLAAQRLFLAEGPAYEPKASFVATNFKTNGTALTMAANHAAGIQDVLINGSKVHLSTVKTDATVDHLGGITSFRLAKPDAILSTDGFITFDNASIIPDAVASKIVLNSSTKLDQYDYILADYIPRKPGQPIRASTQVLVKNLQLSGSDGKLVSFSIDSPGLVEGDYQLGLQSINATYNRGIFPWGKVMKKLSSAL